MIFDVMEKSEDHADEKVVALMSFGLRSSNLTEDVLDHPQFEYLLKKFIHSADPYLSRSAVELVGFHNLPYRQFIFDLLVASFREETYVYKRHFEQALSKQLDQV